jgi:hypothetical protein
MAEPSEERPELAAVPPPLVDDTPLLERLRVLRREQEEHQTELFAVPGFGSALLVELGLVPYETVSKIHTRVTRETRQQPAMRELYMNAECILAATEGFWEQLPDGTVRQAQGTELTWPGFAHALNPLLGSDVTPRACLINMVDDMGVALLAAEWVEWRRGEREVVDREIRRDLGPTG